MNDVIDRLSARNAEFFEAFLYILLGGLCLYVIVRLIILVIERIAGEE
jgi:hypothetical protein